MAMQHIVYWLLLWVGIVGAAFALMTVRQVVAHLRKRRVSNDLVNRSVTPILRFNLRKHYIPEIKAGAAQSLERMEPGEMTYRLREVLLNHDAGMRAAMDVLDHIEARSSSRDARRGAGAESRKRLRI
jgi:hypothetical protein